MKEVLISIFPIMRYVLFLAVIIYIAKYIYDKRQLKKSENDPDSLAYYFKKYPKLNSKDGEKELFNLLNDPNTDPEDRTRLAHLHELIVKLNSKEG